MSWRRAPGAAPSTAEHLEIRRIIQAPAEFLFAAWTEPDRLKQWWGPAEVTCPMAEIDLKPGGRFRIANRFADGSVLWITGAFLRIKPPKLLTFTWQVEGRGNSGERVTVRFRPMDNGTEVTITHERIPDSASRKSHAAGWQGCLDGLAGYFTSKSEDP